MNVLSVDSPALLRALATGDVKHMNDNEQAHTHLAPLNTLCTKHQRLNIVVRGGRSINVVDRHNVVLDAAVEACDKFPDLGDARLKRLY